MNNIIQAIVQIIISMLCVIGSLTCINYILENYIYGNSKKQKRIFIKEDNTAYLILNVDIIGDKLEYYIRQIQDDIKNKRCAYISKIILYSEKLGCPQCEEEHQDEIARICELLTFDYSNVIFIKGGFSDNVFAL